MKLSLMEYNIQAAYKIRLKIYHYYQCKQQVIMKLKFKIKSCYFNFKNSEYLEWYNPPETSGSHCCKIRI